MRARWVVQGCVWERARRERRWEILNRGRINHTITPSTPLGKRIHKPAARVERTGYHALNMASEDQDVAASRARPGWPYLALSQFAVLCGLCFVALASTPPPPPPLGQRLQQLPPEQTAALLGGALQEADTGRALSADDEQRTARFLTLLAQAAGMRISEVTFRPGVSADGIRPVDARLTLQGDPYNLPIFLDGLYRQRAVNHPLSVKGEGSGRSATFSVLLRYYRPAHSELGWVAARLAEEAPEAVDRAPILEQAARLSEWRHFQGQERRLVSQSAEVRDTVARQLAQELIAMRTDGTAVDWHHEVPEPVL